MKRRVIFIATATPIVWLIVVAPITTLISWWIPSISTLNTLVWSMLLAPIASISIFSIFQTSNLRVKWPVTQLIGWTTVLMNVVIACSLLLFFLPATTVAWIATVLWVAISCHAIWKAHNIKDTQLELRSNKLCKSYTLMHLSDIHAGSRGTGFIDKVVTQAMHQQPDIVLITGDLLDSSAVDAAYLEPLSRFTCPVFLCLGNHERYVDLQNAINAISANKVRVLRDESIIFDELEIIGIDDTEDARQVETILPTLNRTTSAYQILMYHKPQGFEAAAANNIDLMLSGHTHGGQVWPFGLLVKRQFPFISGEYRHQGSTLYVSEGTGTWGPIMRLGTRSEMTLITIAPT